jgi:hypothetical protein
MRKSGMSHSGFLAAGNRVTFCVAFFWLALAAPVGAEPLAYVTAQGADALSIVDLAQGRVIETVKIGQ